MSCTELRPLLAGFVDGELEPAELEQVLAHVAACDDCAEELGRQEQAAEAAGGLVPVPSGDAWDAWQTDLEASLGGVRAPRRSSRGGQLLRAAVALAAAVLITVNLVGRLTQPPPTTLAGSRLKHIEMPLVEPRWNEADPIRVADVSDAAGWEAANLKPAARQALAEAGLVQVPSSAGHVAELFEAPAPNAPRPLVTADAALLLSGGVADSAALALERAFLIPGLKRLLALLDRELRAIEVAARDDAVERAARLARERYAVAAVLEGVEPNLDAKARARVDAEVERVRAASEPKQSPVLGRVVDYRRCAPTGFYLGDAALRDHVRAIHWLRLSGLSVDAKAHPDQARAAGLVVLALARGRLLDAPFAGRNGLWLQSRLEAAVEVLFGEPDELTPFDLLESLKQGLGRWRLAPSDLASADALAAFSTRARQTAAARGQNQVRSIDGGPRMILLGNTRSLQGRTFSALAAPEIPTRPLPTSLDLLALLGSRRALTIVSTERGFPLVYETKLEALQAGARGWLHPEGKVRVRSSLEQGRLWSLSPLVTRPPRRLPFQASPRYRGRLLLAALAGLNSPAPCRDVVPQATPAAGALPLVEPLPRLYARLGFSARRLARALEQLGEQIGPRAGLKRARLRLRRVAWLCQAFEQASLAQLEGRPLSDAVTARLRCTGSILRRLGPQRWSSAEDLYERVTPEATQVLHRVVHRLDRLVVVTSDPETGRLVLAAGPALAAREAVTAGERLSADDPEALAGDDPSWATHITRRTQ